jgi:hypothetical protein
MHLIVGVLLVALAGVVGVWGLARSRRIAEPTSEDAGEGRWFGHMLQLTHTLVLATGLIGLVLLVEGHTLSDPLHARVYGPFMVVAIIASYSYRTKDPRRNVIVFAVGALIILALGLRALATGG